MPSVFDEVRKKAAEREAAQKLHLVKPGEAKPPRQPRTLADALKSGLGRLSKGPVANPLQTGFVEVDEKITPLEPRQVTILGADQGSGKSTAAMQIALHAAATGHAVAYLNLEMPEESFGIRTLANYAQVASGRVFRHELQDADWAKLHDAAREIWEPAKRIELGDRSLHCESKAASVFCRDAKANAEGRGEVLGLIVVDHVLMTHVTGVRAGDKDGEGKARADWLKRLSDENECHVLGLVHITRDASKKGAMPTMNELASSAWFARHADNVWLMHTPRDKDGAFIGEPTRFSCQKSRWGDTFAVSLEYRLGMLWPWSLGGGGRRL